MSQHRRPRTSIGGAIPTTTRIEANLTQIQQFEDFRRRHAKQNKDIIAENIGRKSVVKGLQDEVDKLQKELLLVKQANLNLQTELKRIRKVASTSINETTRQALDQLLAAVPALQQLRFVLDSVKDEDDEDCGMKGVDLAGWTNMGTSIATRPAAGARVDLEILLEGDEANSEAEMLPVTIRQPKSRRRSSSMASTAAPRSPYPTSKFPINIDTPSSPSTSSPLSQSSVSPSPQKRVTKLSRRRRESGLISAPSSSPLSAALDSPEPESAGGNEARVGDTSEWEEGEQVILTPEDVAVLQEERSVEDLIEEEDEIDLKGKGRAKLGPVTQMDTSFLDPVSKTETSHSRLSELATMEDESGRNRRARKSVSYKEPSLTKKMRKPDGVDEYARFSVPRQSINITQIDATPRSKPISSSSSSSTSTSKPSSSSTSSKPSSTSSDDTGGRTPTPIPRVGVRSSPRKSIPLKYQQTSSTSKKTDISILKEALGEVNGVVKDAATDLPEEENEFGYSLKVVDASRSSGKVSKRRASMAV